jgi:hypothetical protein
MMQVSLHPGPVPEAAAVHGRLGSIRAGGCGGAQPPPATTATPATTAMVRVSLHPVPVPEAVAVHVRLRPPRVRGGAAPLRHKRCPRASAVHVRPGGQQCMGSMQWVLGGRNPPRHKRHRGRVTRVAPISGRPNASTSATAPLGPTTSTAPLSRPPLRPCTGARLPCQSRGRASALHCCPRPRFGRSVRPDSVRPRESLRCVSRLPFPGHLPTIIYWKQPPWTAASPRVPERGLTASSVIRF